MRGQSLRDAILAAIGKHIDLSQYDVFIFGSEASGVATSRSDVDIGLRGRGPLQRSTIQRIRDELAGLRTLRTFDVVDFSASDPAFVHNALQHAEKL